MCSKCNRLSETIARYRRLKQQINDQRLQDAADSLVDRLEAEKLSLHSRE
jgi:hypothetical protein